MKLKKIVSLALAGIMAVSMLAGCGDNDKKDPASSTETSTATGYSAKLADELKDTAAKSYVTFKDNADDEAALEVMLTAYTNTDLINTGIQSGVGKAVAKTALTSGYDDFMSDADLNDYVAAFTFEANQKMIGTWKIGQLYAANGTVSVDKVIKNIAELIDDDDLAEELVKEGSSADNTIDVKYSYVVSASVVNVKGTEDLQKNQSTNYVLVTITRTGVTE